MTIINRISSLSNTSAAGDDAAAAEAYIAPPGQVTYGTNVGPGTYTWVVPQGVTSISAVAIGGGGGGPYIPGATGGGGGGGALGYKNNIPVTPGDSITVVVGEGGFHYSFGAAPGSQSYVINASTVRGGPGGYGFGSGADSNYVGDGGGSGGQSWFFQSPGNGAGGYLGGGGTPSTPSFGGGGGGGCSYSSFGGSGAGGGTGLRGTGVLPVGFNSFTVYFYSPWSGYTSYTGFGNGGGGGAGGGTNGDYGQTPWTSWGPPGWANGGTYGGGAGGWGFAGFSGYGGGNGGQGGCRIIWGVGRAFPGTAADDV